MPAPLPTWLTTRIDSESPFRQATRNHLVAKHQKDPRVGELIARLQEKGEAEGNTERQWAQRVCRGGQNIMRDLHKSFSPADEDDILRLAAYMSDHSYAHFFIDYVNAPKETQGEYSEMIQRISPIIADLQPQVAVGYAQDIHDVYAAQGKTAEVEAMFLTIAQEHPQAIMGNYRRLEQFGNYDALLEVAQAGVDEMATTSDANDRFAKQVRAQRAVEAQGYGRK